MGYASATVRKSFRIASEEHSAGNPHATFCGSWRQVTAVGDPVADWVTTGSTRKATGHSGHPVAGSRPTAVVRASLRAFGASPSGTASPAKLTRRRGNTCGFLVLGNLGLPS